MASGILHSTIHIHLFLFELLAGSSVVGLTKPTSVVRPLMFPVVTASVYGIVKTVAKLTGPRHAGLLGGFSFLILLRYIDAALISKWDFETQGPTRDIPPKRNEDSNKTEISSLGTGVPVAFNASIRNRLVWGWNTLWSFRQVNTPYEVRNTPLFSTTNGDYVPSRWHFVARKVFVSAGCYLALDVLGQQPSPSDAAIFDPVLIPFFRRISDVTLDQVKLRAVSVAMFDVTFCCITQGAYSVTAAISVALGFSKSSSWRPAFGSIAEAYDLRNFWGKFWHQFMRRLLSAPAAFVTYNILSPEADPLLAGSTSTLLAFLLSGIMHMAVGHSSGASLRDTSVLQFFITQALGVIVETSVSRLLQRQHFGALKAGADRPSVFRRVLGFSWVIAFLAWSGPTWIYPGIAQQAKMGSSGSFLPYSVIKAWKGR